MLRKKRFRKTGSTYLIRPDGDKTDLRRRYFLSDWKITVEFPSHNLLFCSFWDVFSLVTHFSWNFGQVVLFSLKKLSCDIHKLPGSCFQVLRWNPILIFVWQCCENWLLSLLLGNNYLSLAIMGNGESVKNSASFWKH